MLDVRQTHKKIAREIADRLGLRGQEKGNLVSGSNEPDRKRKEMPRHHDVTLAYGRILDFVHMARRNHLEESDKLETARLLGNALHFVEDMSVPSLEDAGKDTGPLMERPDKVGVRGRARGDGVDSQHTVALTIMLRRERE